MTEQTTTVIEPTELVVLPNRQLSAIKGHSNAIRDLKRILKRGVHYGIFPGVDKPSLFQAGAEVVEKYFKLRSETQPDRFVEDFDRGLFHYVYSTSVFTLDGTLLAIRQGSCNSREAGFGWSWVNEADLPRGIMKEGLKMRGGKQSEFSFAIDKAETTGAYGKPAEYWARWRTAILDGTARQVKRKTKTGKEMDAWEMDGTQYRLPNPDVFDKVHAIMLRAQKRSYVAAIRSATGCGEVFTQDIEDNPGDFTEHASTTDPELGNKSTGEIDHNLVYQKAKQIGKFDVAKALFAQGKTPEQVLKELDE